MAMLQKETEGAIAAFEEKFTSTARDLLTSPITSHEAVSAEPEKRARELIKSAAIKCATISGTTALPGGIVGMLTILPDLIANFRIQRQLVADIAAAYGKSEKLLPETMLYCLFQDKTGKLLESLVTRVGRRVLVRRAPLKVLEGVLEQVGIRIGERLTGKSLARIIPIIAAIGLAGYSYYDAAKVGHTALTFFSSEIIFEDPPGEITGGTIQIVPE